MNHMEFAANPLKEGTTPMREMLRQLYNPTPEEIEAHRAKVEALNIKRREAIAKLDAQGYYK